jgi:hypothetical protein
MRKNKAADLEISTVTDYHILKIFFYKILTNNSLSQNKITYRIKIFSVA